jgi:hypothetical protein
VAVSLLAKPRLTADIDVLVWLSDEDVERFGKAASDEGFEPRIADAEQFARRNRVLLLRHAASGINVDIQLAMLPFEEDAISRCTVHQIGELALSLPTPEDMIIFKAVAHRPKDLLDIQDLIEHYPRLDRERVRRLVQEFARGLDMAEIWDDIAGWLGE